MQDIATNPPAHRRAGFEVAGWDGARWILEGIYDSGVEAATQAKVVLGKRLGVKVTQEVYNAVEGTFKGRVVFTEYRGDPPKSEKRKTAGSPTLARQRAPRELIGASDAALYVAIASLIVSIIAMVFSVMR